MPNIRQKGQRAEREAAKLFNDIVVTVRRDFNRSVLETRDLPFQRNQNQSAVGGSDLSNNLNLEIEVKNQAQYSVGSWWKQCVESAARHDGGIPILMYKIPRKGWGVIMELQAWNNVLPYFPQTYNLPGTARFSATDTIVITDHELGVWFTAYYMRKLQLGEAI